MTLRTRILTAVCLAGMIAAALPEPVEAQRRAVVRVAPRPRATVVVGVGAPYYYPAWGAWGYYGGYYGWYAPYFYAQYPYPYRYDDSASLRLEVKPRQAEVFVDGYFAGTVDDFDGILQRLHLEPGDHDIQLFLPGHRLHTQRVYLQPHKTFRIRHTMVPLAAGDAEPARPAGEPLPRRDDDDVYDRRRPEDRRGPGDRDRDAPPRARDNDGFGSIALRVQPADAEVMIDGEKWQGAPGERLLVELGTGPHRVEIRREGYRTYMTEITVRPGETTSLNVAMTANK